MKKRTAVRIFLFTAFLIFSSVFVSAENSEITLFAGGFLGDTFVYRPPQVFEELNAAIDDNFVGGFRLAYFLHPRIAVEGGLAFTPSSIFSEGNFDGGATGSSIVNVDTYIFNANAVMHLINGPVIPFLTAGVAAVHFDFQTPAIPGVFLSPSGTDAAFNAGGGIKIPLRDKTAVRFDARYYWIDPQFSFEGDPRFVELSGGVAILFNF